MIRPAVLVAALLFAGCERLAAGDLETAYANLQGAVAKKDPVEVKKLAAETCALARQAAAQPAPAEESEKDTWKKIVAYAKDVELYTEFALYSTAVQTPAAASIELFVALEQQNPKSKYFAAGYAPYLAALAQSGQGSKIDGVARKAVQHHPDDEDLLLYLADADMGRRQTGAAATYAERLIAVLARHGRPEGLSAADWERKKAQALARAYWIAGYAHFERQDFLAADQDLRQALPLVQGDPATLAAALFHLSVANYQLGRQGMNRAQILQAADFSDKCAALRSPYQQQAWTNAHAMRTEATKMVARKK